MATATMATAAGAAALLYYTLTRKLASSTPSLEMEVEGSGSNLSRQSIRSVSTRVVRRPAQAPATWLETISTLSETLRFTYSETLGKWPIGDLAFGISFLLKKQGNLHVASIYAGSDSIQLRGAEIIAELRRLLNLLTLCWHFSKKPFLLFLEETGYSQEDVLLQEPKAGLLKPAFTILIDRRKKCFLLLIRGTHSIRDTLTAATGAVVPFHHTVVHEGGVSNLVLGYAHCGMVAAARWIAKLATPCLLQALGEYPGYEIKIVGHSLGGGTAALLTYVLRERKEFSASTCVTFAPAACMTWELAESGTHFVTSVINGSDLVPTFSAASVDDLRSEVTASAWLNDLKNQIEQTRFLSTVYRSASALGSRLPSIASAKARVAGAGAILRPVSNSTQVVMSRARNVAQAALARPSFRLSSWSCMGPRKRTTAISSSEIKENGSQSSSTVTIETTNPLLMAETIIETTEITELPLSTGETSMWSSQHDFSGETMLRTEDDGMDNGERDCLVPNSSVDGTTEEELWQQLEHELYGPRDGDSAEPGEEITEEDEKGIEDAAESSVPVITEAHRFYPPGKIMHIVTVSPAEPQSGPEGEIDEGGSIEPSIGIFRTPRSLYSKLRLSQTMINDHFMPIYKRKIEQLISELEKEIMMDCCADDKVL